MKLKDKIKSYSFWVSLASAIILILKILGNRFGFVIDETMVSDLFTALCSILVLLGIIVPPQNINNLAPQNHKITPTETSLNYSTPTDSDNSSSDKIESDNKDCIIQEESTYPEITNSEPIKEVEYNKQNEDILQNQNSLDCQETINHETKNQEFSNSQIVDNSVNKPADIKSLFFDIKEKFSGNLDSYIFELQEEIRKTREGM